MGIVARLTQAAKNSGSGQGLGSGPGSYSHTATATKVETLKEEEEELKRKVEQCKVSGRLELPGCEREARAGGSLPHFTEEEAEAQRGDVPTQGHTAGKQQSQDLSPGSQPPSSVLSHQLMASSVYTAHMIPGRQGLGVFAMVLACLLSESRNEW